MNILLKPIRIIFYPLLIVVTILQFVLDMIYGPKKPRIAGYSWYNKSNFETLLKTAKDEEIVSSYEEWKENAEQTVAVLRARGMFVLKVRININEMNRWLKKQKLPNLHKNRQLFIGKKVLEWEKDPFI